MGIYRISIDNASARRRGEALETWSTRVGVLGSELPSAINASEIFTKVNVSCLRRRHTIPSEDLAITVALVETRRLERERGDENVGAAACPSLGFEMSKKHPAKARTPQVFAHPGHPDPGGHPPRPATHPARELIRVIEDPDGELTGRRNADGKPR